MRKLNLLLLCGTVLSLGFALPGEIRADDRDTPFDVYARYARKIVAISERGAGAMDNVVESAVPRIRRLQNAGEFRRARAMAARAVGKIESLGDKTHRAIRECAGNGVRALLRFEGHVPPEVLRALINDLKDLAERAAGYVSDVEDNSIETIRSLFPQVSDDPGGV
ncbi:MAG TPA: hypothetical protein DIC23_10850 [Planctomycetaceae bacterium]|jgi:hypothetical protein|nr:hypothetical protein [Planctomycetaceae bacterium]|tara:strand:+ start:296 stop:793 length:498 start_codon:yes stop_codon:yes gene_type:complete